MMDPQGRASYVALDDVPIMVPITIDVQYRNLPKDVISLMTTFTGLVV